MKILTLAETLAADDEPPALPEKPSRVASVKAKDNEWTGRAFAPDELTVPAA